MGMVAPSKASKKASGVLIKANGPDLCALPVGLAVHAVVDANPGHLVAELLLQALKALGPLDEPVGLSMLTRTNFSANILAKLKVLAVMRLNKMMTLRFFLFKFVMPSGNAHVLRSNNIWYHS